MTTKEICEHYGQIYENVKHMTEYIKGLKKQYSIEVEGDYVEDEFCCHILFIKVYNSKLIIIFINTRIKRFIFIFSDINIIL